MARTKKAEQPEVVEDDNGYRATRYATLGREVEVARDALHVLEARRAEYAPADD